MSHLYVRRRPGRAKDGLLLAPPAAIPVALGRAGILANKREGDGGTPRGLFRPLRLWWRADRAPRPATALPVRRIRSHDAWCEEPADRRYNRPIRLRGAAPGDRLWRDDDVYDYVIEIDHNTRPRIAGRGSAVFIHVARANLGPTAGCVALPAARLRLLLARLSPRTRIVIR